MQKVVSVNVNLGSSGINNENAYEELQFEELNKYLEDGFVVRDKFSNVSNSTNLFVVNITFILEK